MHTDAALIYDIAFMDTNQYVLIPFLMKGYRKNSFLPRKTLKSKLLNALFHFCDKFKRDWTLRFRQG